MSEDPPRTTLADGSQVYPSHREIDPATGMQKDYVVLAEDLHAIPVDKIKDVKIVRTVVGGKTVYEG